MSEIQFHACLLPPRSPRRMRELVIQAAELGFDRYWVSDQTFHADPFVLLADLAERTAIPLGLAVTNPYARHPAQLARAMASISLLYPDRHWIFGLGTANPEHVLAPLGMRAQQRSRHLRVAIEAIRRLAAGESVTVDDPELAFTLRDVSLELDAPATFDLYVGTRGPQVLEHAAGRVADGAIVEGQTTPAGIRWARHFLDAGSRHDGRERFDRPYVSWQVTEVVEDDRHISSDAREFATMLIASTADATLEQMGVPPEVAQGVRSGRLSAATVPTTELSKFVAAGTAAELRRVVIEAAAAGADAWAAVFTGPPAEAAKSMAAFAAGVIAELRR